MDVDVPVFADVVVDCVVAVAVVVPGHVVFLFVVVGGFV